MTLVNKILGFKFSSVQFYNIGLSKKSITLFPYNGSSCL